jgi:hypothetical protein
MSLEQNGKTTTVVGYFNGNDWPINISSSELGVMITLQPREYLLNSAGQKINDPYFERYLLPRQLSKEVLKSGGVPVIMAPRRINQVEGQAVVTHAHPVRAVTQFVSDAKGVRRPVIPQPVAVAVPLINAPSVRGMSVEEARAQGIIGKPRLVPEDFGAEDNANGNPVTHAPMIRHSIESTPKVRMADQLPAELVNNVGLKPEQALVANAIVQGLAVAAHQVNPADSTGFLNQTAPIVESAQPLLKAQPAPPVHAPLPPPNLAPIERAGEENPVEEAEAPLPAPVGFAESQLTHGAHQTAIAAPPTPIIEALKKQRAPLVAKAAAPKEAKPLVCPICNVPHKYRSQLQTHAKSKHPDKYDEIMAQFQETA